MLSSWIEFAKDSNKIFIVNANRQIAIIWRLSTKSPSQLRNSLPGKLKMPCIKKRNPACLASPPKESTNAKEFMLIAVVIPMRILTERAKYQKLRVRSACQMVKSISRWLETTFSFAKFDAVVRTGDLWVSTALHATNNTIATFLLR